MILKIDLTWLIALVTLVPIFVLLIVATVIALVKRIKMARQYNKKNPKYEVDGDQTLKNALIDALGENNIEKVESEMSRLTITVKDVELVKPDVLKELGANGVLLVGNMVKCSFGDKADEICKLLK